MTVSKEIAEKAARYEKLVNEANELFKELDEWVNENGFDGIYAHSFRRKCMGKNNRMVNGVIKS